MIRAVVCYLVNGRSLHLPIVDLEVSTMVVVLLPSFEVPFVAIAFLSVKDGPNPRNVLTEALVCGVLLLPMTTAFP